MRFGEASGLDWRPIVSALTFKPRSKFANNRSWSSAGVSHGGMMCNVNVVGVHFNTHLFEQVNA